MLTQAQVKELFHYDPENGNLIWRSDFATRKVSGGVAGWKDDRGYFSVKVQNKKYRAHRIVWLWNYGDFPENQLDHINGIRTDNRIENLRKVNSSQNQQNIKKAQNNNKSGFLGVSKIRNKWFARIKINYKQIYIGTYDTKEEAHEAYLAKKRELHPYGTL